MIAQTQCHHTSSTSERSEDGPQASGTLPKASGEGEACKGTVGCRVFGAVPRLAKDREDPLSHAVSAPSRVLGRRARSRRPNAF